MVAAGRGMVWPADKSQIKMVIRAKTIRIAY
jgi:hypothetical protein